MRTEQPRAMTHRETGETERRAAPRGAIHDVPVALIDLDVSNHRGKADPAAIAELAANIAAHGLLQPVRLYGKPGGRFVLGFGFRRLAAVRSLGHETIRAEVLPEAAESEIRAAQAIENLHRRDLSPLEESAACDALIQSHRGLDPANALQTAAREIGRPRAWVERRLALLRLSPRCQRLLAEQRLTLGQAELIARLSDEDQQEEVAGRVSRDEQLEGGESLRSTRYRVEAETSTLHDAPWALDVAFAGKPACVECPHNSANAPGLFDGDAPRKPVCLSLACYRLKRQAAGDQVRRAAEKLTALRVAPAAVSKVEIAHVLGARPEEGRPAKQPVVVRAAAVKARMEKLASRHKPSRSEAAGRAQRQAEEEGLQRVRDWRDACAAALNEAIRSPLTWMLLWEALDWSRSLGDRQPDLKLIRAIVRGDARAVATRLAARHGRLSEWHLGHGGTLYPWVPALARTLKIGLPPRPADTKGAEG